MKKLSILLGLAFIMLISYGQDEQQIRNNVKITGELDITDSLKISIMKPRTGVSNAKFDGILVIGDRSPSGIQKLNVDGGIKLDDAVNGSAGTIDFEGGKFYAHESDKDSIVIGEGGGGESIWTESGDTAMYGGKAKVGDNIYIDGDGSYPQVSIFDSLADVQYFANSASNLVNWKKAFVRSEFPSDMITNHNMSMLWMGDSYSPHYMTYFSKEMWEKYGYGGGYVTFYSNQAPFWYYRHVLYFDANWTTAIDRSDTLNVVNWHKTNTTENAEFFFTCERWKKTRVAYRQLPGAGIFTVRHGKNGAPASTNANGAAAFKWHYLAHSDYTYPADTIYVKVTSGTVRFYGIYANYDDGYSLESSLFFDGGSTPINYYDDKEAASFETVFDTLDLNLVNIISLDAPGVYSEYDSLIKIIKYYNDTLTDVLVINPNDEKNNIGKTSFGDLYRAAKDNNVGFFNMYQVAGRYEDALRSGVLGDSTHPSYEGNYFSTLEISKVLMFETNQRYNLHTDFLTLGYPLKYSLYAYGSSNIGLNLYGTGYKLMNGSANMTFNGDNQRITTGSNNTFFGLSAGEYNTTAGNNTCIGMAAGYNLSTTPASDNNTFVGFYAGYDQSADVRNTCVGSMSGRKHTGSDGSALGYNSLYYQSGVGNTAIGSAAMYGGATSSGTYNTAIGFQSLYNNTSGSTNVAVGYYALRGNTSGSDNTGIGNYAGNSTTAAGGIFIGAYAGYLETGAKKFHLTSQVFATEAAQRTGSLLYGVMSTTVADQTLQTNAKFYVNNAYNYGTDAGANDDYVVTIGLINVLSTGLSVYFYANTANTGGCTLDIDGAGALAAKPLKSLHDTDPLDNYIEAGSIVHVIYDGTNFQIMTPDANP